MHSSSDECILNPGESEKAFPSLHRQENVGSYLDLYGFFSKEFIG